MNDHSDPIRKLMEEFHAPIDVQCLSTDFDPIEAPAVFSAKVKNRAPKTYSYFMGEDRSPFCNPPSLAPKSQIRHSHFDNKAKSGFSQRRGSSRRAT